MTASTALNNAISPFVELLAKQPLKKAIAIEPHLKNGINSYRSQLCHKDVASSLGINYMPLEKLW